MNGNQEKMKNDPERGFTSPENNIELKPNAIERLEKDINNPEKTVELSPNEIETNTEKARTEALDIAKSTEFNNNVEKKAEKEPKKRRGPINKKQRDKSFSQTMHQVQSELPANSRIFSQIIHNKYIEKTSDIVGGTIARPNAILAGAFSAFILTLLTYTIAKTMGYALSGFETIAAFIVGWFIGITYDYLKLLFSGRK